MNEINSKRKSIHFLVGILLFFVSATTLQVATRSFTYTSGTNRLGKVTVGGSQKSYAYNSLKLPRTVKSGTTSTVTYIYDAIGGKQQWHGASKHGLLSLRPGAFAFCI